MFKPIVIGRFKKEVCKITKILNIVIGLYVSEFKFDGCVFSDRSKVHPFCYLCFMFVFVTLSCLFLAAL